MTVRKLTTPLTEEVITDLKAGDRIEITGVLIYCGMRRIKDLSR